MTPQECYDGIVAFFSKDGAQLARGEGGCYYRLDPANSEPNYAEAPLKCGVGCLIPDKKYRPAMDHVYGSIDEWIEDYDGGVNTHSRAAETFRDIFGDDPATMRFLSDAQGAHDYATDVPDFLAALKHVAVNTHGLAVAS